MRKVLQIVLPFAFVAAAIGAVLIVMKLLSGAEQAAPVELPRAVEVVDVTYATHAAVVEATGTVQASTRVDLVPQVAGRVVWTATGLTPGMAFDRGDVIARIDARDYEAQLAQAKGQLAGARLELALEESRGEQAAREWQLLGREPSSALAKREPQLEAARANVASAEAAVDTARLALERTRLTAPFDAVVLSESLDIGQYVAPGAPVASLIGTDRYRVRVAVPVAQLKLVDAGEEDGSPAIVRQDLPDGGTIRAEGRVVKRLGELDPQTRTAAVLVAVDEPLEQAGDDVPLLPGAYVTTTISGRPVPDVARIPREAVVDGSTVWVADPEDRLVRRDVSIAFGDRQHVYVRSGLETTDRAIVTTLSLPIEGMALDVREAVAQAE